MTIPALLTDISGFCAGLIAGSFLNVLIHRLPRMILQTGQATADSGTQPDVSHETYNHETYNIAFPGSHCPVCRSRIKVYDNIPLLSYLWLRGHCRSCDARIPLIYPVVEISAALAGLLAVRLCGIAPELPALMIFFWISIALTVIDARHYLLPDALTLTLLWCGLLASTQQWFCTPVEAIAGAVTGYMVLWIVYHLFRWLTGREGMGYGDFKLLAAIGAWCGWQGILPVLMLASAGGALTGIAMIVLRKRSRSEPLPFGPWLAGAGAVILCYTLLTRDSADSLLSLLY